jgi:hypothetical protein
VGGESCSWGSQEGSTLARVKSSGWSTLAAWIALGIGLVNLWYGVIRPWWRTRAASPSAQLELLSYQTGSRWQGEERLVVTNHGPAIMHQVDVEAFDRDGKPVAAYATVRWPRMPFEHLHVGQSLYLQLDPGINDLETGGAEIRWHDGRKAQQSRRIGLTHNRVM